MSISIQPTTITTTKIMTSFTINVIQLDLFKSVTVNVMLFGADGNFIEVKTITLSGQDYQKWDNNDQYLIDKIMEILGLSLLQPTILESPHMPEPESLQPEPEHESLQPKHLEPESLESDQIIHPSIVTD